MTTDQIEKWRKLLKAYDEIIAWSREHPNGDIAEFLREQRAEAQRAYERARRESIGEARR